MDHIGNWVAFPATNMNWLSKPPFLGAHGAPKVDSVTVSAGPVSSAFTTYVNRRRTVLWHEDEADSVPNARLYVVRRVGESAIHADRNGLVRRGHSSSKSRDNSSNSEAHLEKFVNCKESADEGSKVEGLKCKTRRGLARELLLATWLKS
jgi:hypothetical protein